MKLPFRSGDENPMTYEWVMIKRRMHPNNWRANNALGYAIVAVLYSGLFYVVIQNARNFEPLFMLYPMMFLPILVLPVVMHGAIAGEKQNRSLEMLFAAPVTPRQIVIGKSLRALPAIGSVLFGCGILMLLIIIVRIFVRDSFGFDTRTGPLIYLVGFCGIAALQWMVTAISLWVSAVSKSVGSSLLGSVGMMVFAFVIVPAMVLPLVALANPVLSERLFILNPAGFLVNLLDPNRDASGVTNDVFGLIAIVAWAITGFVFFHLATARLSRVRKAGEGA